VPFEVVEKRKNPLKTDFKGFCD